MVKLVRSSKNPILKPSDLSWENFLVFNPGVAVKDGTIYLLYRAKGKDDQKSRFGLATSQDGINFERRNRPVYWGDEHTYESQGIEDPRMIYLEDAFYFVYIAVIETVGITADPKWSGSVVKQPRIALSKTPDFYYYHEFGVILPNVIGKDATLFPKKINGKYCLLYRSGTEQTFITFATDLGNWEEHTPLFNKRAGFWDSYRAGAGAPPIETEKGWLLFYHGIGEDKIYRLGLMLLDKNDPRKIIYRSNKPIFEPEMDYEKYGFVPNVVFTCGAIEKDGSYFIYYGAGDQVIGLATVKKRKVLALF